MRQHRGSRGGPAIQPGDPHPRGAQKTVVSSNFGRTDLCYVSRGVMSATERLVGAGDLGLCRMQKWLVNVAGLLGLGLAATAPASAAGWLSSLQQLQ